MLLLLWLLMHCISVIPFAYPSLPTKRADGSPTILLDNGTFIGTSDGPVNKFLGIPFAKPPYVSIPCLLYAPADSTCTVADCTGDLRFRLPVPNDAYNGTYNATRFGSVCPQEPPSSGPEFFILPPETRQFLANNWSLAVTTPESEDCLTVNVLAPVGTEPDAKLPVAVWIFGGGFAFGGSKSVIVQRSLSLGEPVIYVSFNYRVNAFGFLASKEVKEAGVGNIGLQDQREALRWVQKYIPAFGGDPEKVTIWGQSAGAHSVSLHMITNDGNPEGLFRGAFIQSGWQASYGDITDEQATYDFLISDTGCEGTPDTLQCLREVPYTTLKASIAKYIQDADYDQHFSWSPRVDGNFLRDDPQRLAVEGSIARVPFVTGDCDDEGTLSSLKILNVTTEAAFASLLKTYFPTISNSDLTALLDYYPADITQGSPFDTGRANAVTPKFKRFAAITGDLFYQAPRRLFLKHTAAEQNVWMFLFKRFKYLPVLGSLHGSDNVDMYGGKELTDYLVNFANHLDPNGKSVPAWPRFSLEERKLLTLLDGDSRRATIGEDDYRVEGMKLLTKLVMENPL